MKRVKIYVEGATRGKNKVASGVIEFRRAFSQFAARLGLKHMPQFIPCGGRSQTWEMAYQSFLKRDGDEIIMLLVDSEEASKYLPAEAWQHLRERKEDAWLALQASNKRYVFLMVATMETWLIADIPALERHFGQGFRSNAIPAWPDLESVAKEDIYDALDTATAQTKRPYKKGERSFEAFGEVDPSTVARSCPHAEFFCTRLRAECNAL